jgi:hypothetical protein
MKKMWVTARPRNPGLKDLNPKGIHPFRIAIVFELHFGQRAGGVFRRAFH